MKPLMGWVKAGLIVLAVLLAAELAARIIVTRIDYPNAYLQYPSTAPVD
jgi:hypothetical protein